jgi:hypothetical protein
MPPLGAVERLDMLGKPQPALRGAGNNCASKRLILVAD